MAPYQKHKDYWYKNRTRWRQIIGMAVDYADMYELERPSYYELKRCHPADVRWSFFWNTTHRYRPSGEGVTLPDPIVDVDPEFDAPTCFACICSDAKDSQLTRDEIAFLLGASGFRVSQAWKLWELFPDDFRHDVRNLRGDMKTSGLRRLVLGNLREDENDR